MAKMSLTFIISKAEKIHKPKWSILFETHVVHNHFPAKWYSFMTNADNAEKFLLTLVSAFSFHSFPFGTPIRTIAPIKRTLLKPQLVASIPCQYTLASYIFRRTMQQVWRLPGGWGGLYGNVFRVEPQLK